MNLGCVQTMTVIHDMVLIENNFKISRIQCNGSTNNNIIANALTKKQNHLKAIIQEHYKQTKTNV